MARQPAMRVRMDMAIKLDPTDIESVMHAAKAIQNLKAAATGQGFVFTEEVNSRVGSFDLGEDEADKGE